MDLEPRISCIAFEGTARVASGDLAEVVLKVKEVIDRGEHGPVLVFDDVTSERIEVDFRGTAVDVLKKLEETSQLRLPSSSEEPKAPRGPGRPRLGVVAREVTLLPRQWDWLNQQPGGASVAIRKLVEQARRANADIDRGRRAQEAAYRFMSAMAGDEEGFEDATRALFAGNRQRFDELVTSWPADVRVHAQMLAARAFEVPNSA